MPIEAVTTEQRCAECVSNRYHSSKRPRVGYAFFVLGGFGLLLHHGWVAGLRQDPLIEILWTGCFLMLFNVMGWIAPATLAGIEGRAKMTKWRGFVWFVALCVIGAALSWSIGRYVYGVNLFE